MVLWGEEGDSRRDGAFRAWWPGRSSISDMSSLISRAGMGSSSTIVDICKRRRPRAPCERCRRVAQTAVRYANVPSRRKGAYLCLVAFGVLAWTFPRVARSFSNFDRNMLPTTQVTTQMRTQQTTDECECGQMNEDAAKAPRVPQKCARKH
eukprot:scaffold3273_cov126-Isochrysis_galbana.AAC.2